MIFEKLLIALFLFLLTISDGWAENQRRFIDVSACMRGAFKRATCIEAFDDAWDVYREHAPKFKTREKCNAEFKVCVVFNPPAISGKPAQRLTPTNLNYAPPLLGVVLSKDGNALQVLIDTTRRSLGVGVPSRRKPLMQAKPRNKHGLTPDLQSGGFTSPTPEITPISPQIDAPEITSLDGVSSYPVPANRRRNKK